MTEIPRQVTEPFQFLLEIIIYYAMIWSVRYGDIINTKTNQSFLN